MNTLIICIEVFLARMVDVSIGSVRTILLVKGKNLISTVLAFIEILIWFLVAKQTLTSSDTNTFVILSYASGYAFGTYIGGIINKFFVKGNLSLFLITRANKNKIINTLKTSGYGLSVLSEEGGKMVLLIVLKKRSLKKLKALIYKIDNEAFFIVNESMYAINGYIN